jgi:hypothetical protein
LFSSYLLVPQQIKTKIIGGRVMTNTGISVKEKIIEKRY